MKLYNVIGLFFTIYAVWVPQTQQAPTGMDVGTAKTSIFQRSDETNEEYYTRILSKNYYENVDKFDVRVECLKVLLPDLPIWNNDNYLQFVTVHYEVKNVTTYKSKYLTDIKIGWLESYQKYYTRIFEKHSDETLDEYIERLGAIKTSLPSLPCWADNSYMRYVRPHLEAYKLEAGKVGSSSLSIGSSDKDDRNYKNEDDPNEKEKITENVSDDEKEEVSVEVKRKGSEEEETEESTENYPQKNKESDEKSSNKKEQYQKRKGESAKEYCKRILGTSKMKGKKGKKEIKKLLKNLKTKMDASDFKIIKKTCIKKNK